MILAIGIKEVIARRVGATSKWTVECLYSIAQGENYRRATKRIEVQALYLCKFDQLYRRPPPPLLLRFFCRIFGFVTLPISLGLPLP
jgi:hypothetical protein